MTLAIWPNDPGDPAVIPPVGGPMTLAIGGPMSLAKSPKTGPMSLAIHTPQRSLVATSEIARVRCVTN